MKVAIIGGGASGFFSAINIAEKNPTTKITIFEKQKQFLAKVKVSGGGRCNVTNGEWNPKELIKSYPRGNRELRGPFTKFGTGDMMSWLYEHGVETKMEEDGRVFPATDDSQTIIDCFLKTAADLGIKTLNNTSVTDIIPKGDTIDICINGSTIESFDKVIICTGSSPAVWEKLACIGFDIIPPVPSLFSFHTLEKWGYDLAGLSLESVTVTILQTGHKQDGPLLFTHKGFSGPAILKLSAIAARELSDCKYSFDIQINFLNISEHDWDQWIAERREMDAAKKISNTPFSIPKRLRDQLLALSEIEEATKWADLSKKSLQRMKDQMLHHRFKVIGRSPNKEEFVTAGGVDLKEIDFKDYSAKKIENIYFAGEVLNIDAITGGYNFQAAWTSAWMIAQSF